MRKRRRMKKKRKKNLTPLVGCLELKIMSLLVALCDAIRSMMIIGMREWWWLIFPLMMRSLWLYGKSRERREERERRERVSLAVLLVGVRVGLLIWSSMS
jgi:hypothetical protein